MIKYTATQLEKMAGDSRNNGEGLKAIKLYRKAADAYLDDGNIQKSAGCWHMIGVSYKVENDIDKAIKTLLRAIDLYKESGDEVGVGRVYRDIGIAYAYRKQHNKAIEWLEKSVNVLKITNAYDELGISEAKVGLHYIEVKDYKEAEKWILKGLSTIRSSPQWFYEMTALIHLATLRYIQEQYTDAINELLLAESLVVKENQRENQKRRLAQIYGILAQCYLGNKDIDKAVRYFIKAMKLLESMANNVAQVVYDDIDAQRFIQNISSQSPKDLEKIKGKTDLSRLGFENSEYR